MADEIERRFLVEEIPADVELGPGVCLRQGYVAIDGTVNVRVRDDGDRRVLTLKGGHGLSRTEIERELGRAEFDALWEFTDGRRISKTRHRIDLAGVIGELDVFEDRFSGLVIVEVEFGSRDDAQAFHPPAWFGREVTDKPAWNNAALAVDGRPDQALRPD